MKHIIEDEFLNYPMEEEDLGTADSTEIAESTDVVTQSKKVNFLRRTKELSDDEKQQKFDEANKAMDEEKFEDAIAKYKELIKSLKAPTTIDNEEDNDKEMILDTYWMI